MTNPRPDNNQNNLNKGKSSRFEFLDNAPTNNGYNSPGKSDPQSQPPKSLDISNYPNQPVNNPYIDRIGLNQEFGGNQTDINSMLLDDGVYKAGEKVISRGQKINQDSSYKFVDQGSLQVRQLGQLASIMKLLIFLKVIYLILMKVALSTQGMVKLRSMISSDVERQTVKENILLLIRFLK